MHYLLSEIHKISLFITPLIMFVFAWVYADAVVKRKDYDRHVADYNRWVDELLDKFN